MPCKVRRSGFVAGRSLMNRKHIISGICGSSRLRRVNDLRDQSREAGEALNQVRPSEPLARVRPSEPLAREDSGSLNNSCTYIP